MQKKIFTLLVKKLSGELTTPELEEINRLIKENKEVAREYELLKDIWETLPNPYEQEFYNEKNLEIISNEIFDLDKDKQYEFYRKAAYFLIAASLLIFVVTFVFTFKRTVKVINTTESPLAVILPDSSEVILDKKAEISYKLSLLGDFYREVTFSGNAFFKIKKEQHKSFTVHCANLDVSVLGTEFNITQTLSSVNIALVKGKVKVYNFNKLQDTAIIMHPNELVEYFPKSGKIIHKSANVNIYTYWLKDRIVFDNFTISDIAEILKIYYGKILVFNDTTIKYKKIGGSAPSDDLSLIIRALELITDRKIIQSKDTLYFQ